MKLPNSIQGDGRACLTGKSRRKYPLVENTATENADPVVASWYSLSVVGTLLPNCGHSTT